MSTTIGVATNKENPVNHMALGDGHQLWVRYSDALDIWQGFIRLPDGSLMRSPSFKDEHEAWQAILDRHSELTAG